MDLQKQIAFKYVVKSLTWRANINTNELYLGTHTIVCLEFFKLIFWNSKTSKHKYRKNKSEENWCTFHRTVQQSSLFFLLFKYYLKLQHLKICLHSLPSSAQVRTKRKNKIILYNSKSKTRREQKLYSKPHSKSLTQILNVS